MDYAAAAEIVRHDGWTAFQASDQRKEGRLVLLTTKAERTIWDVDFEVTDLIALGA